MQAGAIIWPVRCARVRALPWVRILQTRQLSGVNPQCGGPFSLILGATRNVHVYLWEVLIEC